MEHAFTKDRFWKDGKLIRKRNSRSKEGKVYADPLDYFAEKLEGIVSTYSRIQRAQEVAKEKTAGELSAKVLPRPRVLGARGRHPAVPARGTEHGHRPRTAGGSY